MNLTDLNKLINSELTTKIKNTKIVNNPKAIRDISEKLYDWTKNRWLISFTKEKGAMSEKEKKNDLKKKKIYVIYCS